MKNVYKNNLYKIVFKKIVNPDNIFSKKKSRIQLLKNCIVQK